MNKRTTTNTNKDGILHPKARFDTTQHPDNTTRKHATPQSTIGNGWTVQSSHFESDPVSPRIATVLGRHFCSKEDPQLSRGATHVLIDRRRQSTFLSSLVLPNGSMLHPTNGERTESVWDALLSLLIFAKKMQKGHTAAKWVYFQSHDTKTEFWNQNYGTKSWIYNRTHYLLRDVEYRKCLLLAYGLCS